MIKIEKSPIYKKKDGYLYMPESRINIQNEYKPMLKEISIFFKKLNNKNVQGVYLRGSLIWGLGIKNFSDADFFIITLNQLTESDQRFIKEYMDGLNKKYPFVTRFDIRYFTLSQILSAKENVLIKLTGICIYGEDIKEMIKNPRPGKDVAISLSLIEMEIIKTENEIKKGFYDQTNTKAMCLWIMKRIVRSGLELVSEREGCFTRDLVLCLDKFSKYYPNKRDNLKKAFLLAVNPTGDLKLIKEIFDDIGRWIIAEGKRLGLSPLNYKDINKIIVEKIRSLFDKERIICLLRYGPKEKFDGSSPEDFDFLLLLNKYQKDDYSVLSSLKKMNLPVEIFIDYKNQILSKGIENYQRGCHGSYFFKILSSAETLIGNNYYKENQNKLDKTRIKFDLLYRVEEYFYRIQKNIINSEEVKKLEIEKYLVRILTDLMLINEEIKFQDMHNYHFTHIIYNKLKSTNIIDDHTKNLIREFFSNNIIKGDIIGEIAGDLYEQYLRIRKEII